MTEMEVKKLIDSKLVGNVTPHDGHDESWRVFSKSFLIAASNIELDDKIAMSLQVES